MCWGCVFSGQVVDALNVGLWGLLSLSLYIYIYYIYISIHAQVTIDRNNRALKSTPFQMKHMENHSRGFGVFLSRSVAF